MVIRGLFKAKTDFKQLTDKFGIEKIYLDITDNPEYPNTAEFQIPNKKLETSFNKGDELEVSFNINGRKWEKDGRSGFVQNLTAWKIIKVDSKESVSEENDDLPW